MLILQQTCKNVQVFFFVFIQEWYNRYSRIVDGKRGNATTNGELAFHTATL
jgi:hypothetical protein